MKSTLSLALTLWALSACRSPAKVEPAPPDNELWISPQAFEKSQDRLVEARRRALPQAIVTGGRLAFDDERVAHVSSPVTGRITRILAQLGERVRNGSPLVALLSPDVGSALSDEVKARADLTAAEHDFERQQKLFAEQAASGRDYEGAEDNYRKAKAEEERALQRLRFLRSGQVDAVTQEYTLPSPIAGRVVARYVNPGVEVQGQFSGGTAAELFTIGDIDKLWLFADVGEEDLQAVRLGAPVEVRVLAYPQRVFDGRVEWLSPALDPVLRTARIRCSLPNPEGLLKPEMYATVVIDRPAAERLSIPRDAVVRINDHPFVYVATGTRPDGKHVFTLRQIVPAEHSGLPARGSSATRLPVEPPEPEDVPIEAGLKEGEQVLIEGTPQSSDADERLLLPAEQAAQRISTVAAEQAEVEHVLTVGGRLTFDDVRVSHVFSPVGGQITKLMGAPGQHVRKGDPLAIVLSPDLGSAFSDELKAKADLLATEHELQRQREMYALKASAERDVEAARDSYDRARAEYDRAEQKTRLLREGALDAVSQEYALRSPIDGQVIARMASPGLQVQGQYAGAGNPVELFTVGRIDPLWLLGDVYEVDLPYLKIGAEVTLQVSAYPGQVFRGRVDWISDTLDPVLRTAKVRCLLSNPEGLLRPEMYGVASIAAPQRRAVEVPREAVLRRGDETVVFVEGPPAADGRVTFLRRRVVANEQLSGRLVPVLSGLAAGERVATRGAIFLLGM